MRGGYDAEWQLLNSKYHGVPQNRERVFIVGHSRAGSRQEVFPLKGTNGADRIHQCGMLDTERKNSQRYRVYDGDGIAPSIHTCGGGGLEPYTIEKIGTLDVTRHSQMDVIGGGGIHPTLTNLNEKPKVGVSLSEILTRQGVG